MCAVRDQTTVDPLQALRTSRELIESLHTGRWDMITEARLRGATWDAVALAMNQRTDEIRNEYAAMVDWVAQPPPGLCRPRPVPGRAVVRCAMILTIRPVRLPY